MHFIVTIVEGVRRNETLLNEWNFSHLIQSEHLLRCLQESITSSYSEPHLSKNYSILTIR